MEEINGLGVVGGEGAAPRAALESERPSNFSTWFTMADETEGGEMTFGEILAQLEDLDLALI